MTTKPKLTVVEGSPELGSKALDAIEIAASYCDEVLARLNICVAALQAPGDDSHRLELARNVARELSEDCINSLDVARETLRELQAKAVQS